MVTYGGYRIGDSYACESTAIMESILTDGGEGSGVVGSSQSSKRRTVGESIVAYGGDKFRDG